MPHSLKEDKQYDIVIIGGGINGAGIARDAAGRGLQVLLCEQDDLASHTSSASTKLIHGGLRYLEYYEFRLVREALKEREVLLEAAPHIIWPLQFVLPHDKGQRPAWLIRLGLFLYDNLGGRKRLPASGAIKLSQHEAGNVIKTEFDKAFIYSDCWVEDSRLVALNCLDAAEKGALIQTRTRCTKAVRGREKWKVTLEDKLTGEISVVSAHLIVNATGPWAGNFLEDQASMNGYRERVRHIKGSHIVVPKLFDHPYCYIFQNPDKRIIFAIPYEKEFTLLGTTDVDYKGDLGKMQISPEEVSYICEASSRYFKKPIKPTDVVWSYAGVRPLYNDNAANASAVTRDYVLDLQAPAGNAPLLSIFGGKLTTYRKLAEHAMEKICGALQRPDKPWTAQAPLPGGDIHDADFTAFVKKVAAEYPWLSEAVLSRLARAYGTRLYALLTGCTKIEDLGIHFGNTLYEVEVRYLQKYEWAVTAEDIVWRRSKLGLHLSPAEISRLESWLQQQEQQEKTRAKASNSGH